MPDPAWSTIFLVLIVAVNFMGVRIYGELEYWFALIKILIVIVFIIIGKKEKKTLRSQLRWYSMI
jgi:lysine-specific permease